MTFVDYLIKNEKVSLKGIIPWLQNIYMNDHNWKTGEKTAMVAEMKHKQVLEDVLIYGVEHKLIEGKLLRDQAIDGHGDEMYDEFDGSPIYIRNDYTSYVIVSSLIKYIYEDIRNKSLIPDKLLALLENEDLNKGNSYNLKEIDPDTKRELETLKNEKVKWDASIKAATNVGMIFYANGIDGKMTKEEFTIAFAEQLGKDLPDSTIDKIYKALPAGYRQLGGRPKKDTVATNLDDVISAAVFIGTLHEAHERLKLESLKQELKEMEIKAPDDETLKKIIATLKKLDI